jgi:hypothetical protein
MRKLFDILNVAMKRPPWICLASKYLNKLRKTPENKIRSLLLKGLYENGKE